MFLQLEDVGGSADHVGSVHTPSHPASCQLQGCVLCPDCHEVQSRWVAAALPGFPSFSILPASPVDIH